MTENDDLTGLSRRERQIMDFLFEKGKASVGEVMDGIADPPSYSAVRAMLRTLEQKGRVAHVEDGRAYIPTRRRNVNGCAQYRTDLANVGIAAQHRGYRSDARYRRVSIERQRSLRCETDVEATRDQQLSK